MDNIYDVILNFNKFYYEIYEWKEEDDIKNIRKIPFFKISKKAYLDIKNKDVILSRDCLNKIKEKYDIYFEEDEDFMCIVTEGKEAMGIIIDNNGYVKARSAMLFDEEDEVLEEARGKEEIKICFDKAVSLKKYDSRLEYEKKEILYNFINKVSDKMILKYVYYDYFLRDCDDDVKIKKDLIMEIDNCKDDKLLRLFDAVSLFLN